MKNPREIRAIPTLYKGIEFRSRFEANVAFALDQNGVSWEYEPQSFLLPSGVHFMPDFRIRQAAAVVLPRVVRVSDVELPPLADLWIEARGYVTERGERQLAEFPAVMPPTDVFVVWRPGQEFRFDEITFSPRYHRDFTNAMVMVWVETVQRGTLEMARAIEAFICRFGDQDVVPFGFDAYPAFGGAAS